MDSHKLLRDVLKEIERGWYHPPPSNIWRAIRKYQLDWIWKWWRS